MIPGQATQSLCPSAFSKGSLQELHSRSDISNSDTGNLLWKYDLELLLICQIAAGEGLLPQRRARRAGKQSSFLLLRGRVSEEMVSSLKEKILMRWHV